MTSKDVQEIPKEITTLDAIYFAIGAWHRSSKPGGADWRIHETS